MSAMKPDDPVTVLLNMPPPPCAELLGWKLLDADPEAGVIRVGYEGRPEFLNPAGKVQGGIAVAMLDDAMGPAVLLASQGQSYTASIDIAAKFLAPVEPGPLVAEDRVVQLGKTVAFMEAALMDEGGTVLVRATASARVVPVGRLGG